MCIYLCAETTRTTYRLKRPWNKTPVLKVLVPSYHTIPKKVWPEPTNWFKKCRTDKLKLVKLWHCHCAFDLENSVSVTKPTCNPQKLHIQDVHNCHLLSVTKYLTSFRNCDWQNEMRRKLFISEKGLFLEIQPEWLNLHILEACLPEKHAFIVCKAFKTIHILISLCTSINISSHTCDMLSSRNAVCCCQYP